MIDTSHVYYDGNSEGGIMGGVFAAVSPDVRRAVLGVTGMDYGNLLLARSTDFSEFNDLLDIFYRDPSMHPVILDLLDHPADRRPANIDPHEDPRNTPAAQEQISDFLEPSGAVVNVRGRALPRVGVHAVSRRPIPAVVGRSSVPVGVSSQALGRGFVQELRH